MTTTKSFINRLSKLKIKVDLLSNYPYIYLWKINGKKVKEKHNSKWGFTVCMKPIMAGDKDEWTDITLIFETIRKYL